jgi:acyl transferase domain-containing protein
MSVLVAPGSFIVLGGFFIEDHLDAFDPNMFDISPVDGLWTDPQQRKFSEVICEVFESSDTTLDYVARSKTGCFISCFSLDYQVMSPKESDFRHSYAAIGIDTGIISHRISHVFELKGPG